MTEKRSFLECVRKCNNYLCDEKSSRPHSIPFKISNIILGYVRPEFHEEIKKKPSIFIFSNSSIEFHPSLDTTEKRSTSLNEVLKEWHQEKKFICLRGWKNEIYCVSERFGSEVLLKIERAAVGIFGFVSYGCHLNGYIIDPVTKEYKFWVGRRALKKDTWGGFLDNFAAGGLPEGLTPHENIIKECEEEASLSPEICQNCVPVGAISYFLEVERGLFPEVEFIYDLELPLYFKPAINDGEVEGFLLLTLEEAKERIYNGEFKPNCALVLIDFFIRKGLLKPEDDPHYMKILTGMRVDVYSPSIQTLQI